LGRPILERGGGKAPFYPVYREKKKGDALFRQSRNVRKREGKRKKKSLYFRRARRRGKKKPEVSTSMYDKKPGQREGRFPSEGIKMAPTSTQAIWKTHFSLRGEEKTLLLHPPKEGGMSS